MIVVVIFGLHSAGKETVKKEREIAKDVYFRLDTLEIKMLREGVWATSRCLVYSMH